jgi:hypothetical protein
MAKTPKLDPMAFFDLGCEVTRHVDGLRKAKVLEAMLQVVKGLRPADPISPAKKGGDSRRKR